MFGNPEWKNSRGNPGRIEEGTINAITNLVSVDQLTDQEQTDMEDIYDSQKPLARYTLSAVTYSPTPCRVQYHQRWQA